jgi:hypothetical protein
MHTMASLAWAIARSARDQSLSRSGCLRSPNASQIAPM